MSAKSIQPDAFEELPPEFLAVTDENFDEVVLNASRPVVVGFCSRACPPCRLQRRLLLKLGLEYVDRLTIITVDVETAPEAVLRYQITHIPAQLFFVEGQLVERLAGLSSITVLREKFKLHATRTISQTA